MIPTGILQALGSHLRPVLSRPLGERIAKDIARFAPADGTMIDFGGSVGLFAEPAAEPAGRLFLCEADPDIRTALAGRLAGNPKIFIRKPEDIATMTPQSIDVIVMHSMTQHLAATDFDTLVRQFRRLLRVGGLLVLGDVVPARHSTLTDVSELLRFAGQNGVYGAAFFALLRTGVAQYRSRLLGRTRHDEEQMVGKLEAAGFTAQRARTNIGHNGRRMTFLAHAR
jgi:hypothetical protein